MVGIVAQNYQKVREFLKANPIPFPILVDQERKVARDYGVLVRLNFESVNIARPAHFILDARGIIRYIFISSRQTEFPSDQELYQVLEELKDKSE